MTDTARESNVKLGACIRY